MKITIKQHKACLLTLFDDTNLYTIYFYTKASKYKVLREERVEEGEGATFINFT